MKRFYLASLEEEAIIVSNDKIRVIEEKVCTEILFPNRQKLFF